MKALVVTDPQGVVTALVQIDAEDPEEGAPDEIRLEAMGDQLVHKIELPAEFERMESLLDIYETVEREYRLDVKTQRLTKVGKTSE